MFLHRSFRDSIMVQIGRIPLKDRRYRYSCLNFMLLKEMVEKIAGMPMDMYLDSVFYAPMGLRHTAFLPLRKFPKEQIVPSVETDFLRGANCRDLCRMRRPLSWVAYPEMPVCFLLRRMWQE